MQLERLGTEGTLLQLRLSSVEVREVSALAKYARRVLEYDAQASYVAQVFVYESSQPKDLLASPNAIAAFDILEKLTDGEPGAEQIDLVLLKEQMRVLVMILGKAAESEEQALTLQWEIHEKFHVRFPAEGVKIDVRHYIEAFDALLTAIADPHGFSFERPSQ